jgi:CheY-like chemotaxis protein
MTQKALIVDNDYFFVEFLAEFLQTRGYQVIKAYDGKEGISKLDEQEFDLLFVDMIMPKIDGTRLIKYARSKFPDAHFHIVALSGVIIEEMHRLDDVPADFFVAKGPMEKMADHITKVMDRIQGDPEQSSSNEKVFIPGNLIPSRVADELIQTADFQRAISECIGMGILILDHDARILDANAFALDIMEKADHEVLNQRLGDIIPVEDSVEGMKILKNLVRQPQLTRLIFFTTMNSQRIRIIASLLRIDNEIVGWILAMEVAE